MIIVSVGIQQRSDQRCENSPSATRAEATSRHQPSQRS